MPRLYRSDHSIRFDNTFYDAETNVITDPIETENFLLIQAVDNRYLDQGYIAPHVQCCDIELTALLSGHCSQGVGSLTEEMVRHDVHLAFRNELHGITYPGGCRFQNLAFSIKPDSPYVDMMADIRARFAARRLLATPTRVRELIERVVHELYHLSPATSPLAFDCFIGLVMLELSRVEDDSYPPELESDNTLMAAVVNYIDNHFREMRTVEELSEQTRLSYSRVYHLFAATYAISLKQYLTFKKMEYACMRLQESRDPLGRIAEELGYSTSFNFSRAFKHAIGVAPRDYREAPFPLENPLHRIEDQSDISLPASK